MRGLHLTADVYGCRCESRWLNDAELLARECRAAVAAAGLTAVADRFHAFDGGGVTATVLLAESHLALHTWPELGGVTIDVYVCNYSGDNTLAAESLMRSLVQLFEPERVELNRLMRGDLRQPVSDLS